MFKSNPKDALSGPETMDLIESLLKNAREITPTTRLVLCGYVDELLGQMKRFVKRPSSSTTSSSASKISSNDGDQAMRERVVRAYLEHAELVEPLGEVKLAQDSQRRASKFG
ncbi:hypothetical protein BGZ83_010064 [Gryganskiella cystojenkinii]|nr:hypothetical protein BGZ83_010064 [Gryganskiella cystojenkinii]